MEIELAFNELHGSCKLDGQNYVMWHRQIQYFLHHKKILDHLTTSTAEPIGPENGQTAQYRRELDAYNKWLEQDMSARFIMLSCMHDNLIREYENPTAKELWEVLKVAYGSTSASRLRALTLRFNQYVLDPKHSMIQYLDVMKDMIRELQNAGCELSDEQQVLVVLSVASHLKLEADRRESECAQQAVFVAHTGQRKLHKGKRWNKSTGAGPSNSQSQKKNLAPQDIGATKHVTRDQAGFVNYHRVPACSHYIAMGNGTQEEVLGIGSYQLKLSTGCELLLSDVQYAPNIRCNLLSVTALMGQGFSFLFEQMSLSIYFGKDLYGLGFMNNGFFMLELANEFVSYVSSSVNIHDIFVLWHARLGHIGQERMTRLAREGLLGSLAKVNHPVCEPCMVGKACRKPFGKAKRPTCPLELVHSDICGPMNVRACHGAFYFLTFIDDYSRYGSVYLLSLRSKALECFKRFLAEVENQREMNLKVLRTDRGREYLSEQFKRICEDKGIIRHLTIPYTPQQNGVAERRNQTLLEMARSMMAQANLPISFWGDAILTVAYILNRVPSKSIPSTPYELWHGRKPSLESLCQWGSAGYCEHSKGYVMYGEYPNKGMTEIESHDVDFLEEDFPSISEVKGNFELYELRDPQGGASITVEANVEEYLPSVQIEGESFMWASVDIDEPATYEEAVTSPNANEWITAMKEEMSSMAKNNVWELVDLPTGRKTIGNKWVLKVKRKADGSIDKFKARLVAKGYTQNEMDVKTAFLNGELDEEICMDQPEGFQGMGLKRKVCRLKRSIYGLKQSSSSVLSISSSHHIDRLYDD
ncbi:UNVERIFIED_CONTAM: Retrovirus-related Pol polyprotein from transposon TNT 1-94 [Sesamum radiatum]|uniref:Retrovirus-related Pol polyprotein from transposon TNT 1-94 n=1 Tax=Sesamum radiatum TaxID=300843 RepID=A0AAW2LBN9_SESRA